MLWCHGMGWHKCKGVAIAVLWGGMVQSGWHGTKCKGVAIAESKRMGAACPHAISTQEFGPPTHTRVHGWLLHQGWGP